ncbi:MAG: hypothetical protein ACK5TN_22410, partial [Acidobacteriota bacterium]
ARGRPDNRDPEHWTQGRRGANSGFAPRFGGFKPGGAGRRSVFQVRFASSARNVGGATAI